MLSFMTDFRENTHLYKHAILESINHHVFVWIRSWSTDLWCNFLWHTACKQDSSVMAYLELHTYSETYFVCMRSSVIIFAWFVQAKACWKARGSRKRAHHETCTHTHKIAMRAENFTAEITLICMICKNQLILSIFTMLFEDRWDYQGWKRAGLKSVILLSNFQRIFVGKTWLPKHKWKAFDWMEARWV